MSDIDGWFLANQRMLMKLIGEAYGKNRTLARFYLLQHAIASGSTTTVSLAAMDGVKVWRSVQKMGPAGLKAYLKKGVEPEVAVKLMLKSIEGSLYRHIFNGSRETIAATVRNSGTVAGWRRTSLGVPCAFCAMLVSRGAVYTKNSVHFQAHDNDKCVPEPLYRHVEETEQEKRLFDLWKQSTKNLSGADAIAAFRNAYNPGG